MQQISIFIIAVVCEVTPLLLLFFNGYCQRIDELNTWYSHKFIWYIYSYILLFGYHSVCTNALQIQSLSRWVVKQKGSANDPRPCFVIFIGYLIGMCMGSQSNSVPHGQSTWRSPSPKGGLITGLIWTKPWYLCHLHVYLGLHLWILVVVKSGESIRVFFFSWPKYCWSCRVQDCKYYFINFMFFVAKDIYEHMI